MNIIETTAPIGIDYLKQYFTDKTTTFIIDYEKSELKGQKLLTYLSNLELPCDVKGYDEQFIKDYLETTALVNIPSLELNIIELLAQLKLGKSVPFKHDLLNWEKKIDSLTLYNMNTIKSEQIKDWVKSFPEDDTNDLKGINFVSLIKNEEMYSLFNHVKEKNLTYFSKYFNDYMFKGKNLYSFWANENNPMFLLTWGISSGEVQKLQEAQQ